MGLAAPEALARGVWTASAGNMAQGLAWEARRRGDPLHRRRAGARSGGEARGDRSGSAARIVKVPFERWWQILVDHALSRHGRASSSTPRPTRRSSRETERSASRSSKTSRTPTPCSCPGAAAASPAASRRRLRGARIVGEGLRLRGRDGGPLRGLARRRAVPRRPPTRRASSTASAGEASSRSSGRSRRLFSPDRSSFRSRRRRRRSAIWRRGRASWRRAPAPRPSPRRCRAARRGKARLRRLRRQHRRGGARAHPRRRLRLGAALFARQRKRQPTRHHNRIEPQVADRTSRRSTCAHSALRASTPTCRRWESEGLRCLEPEVESPADLAKVEQIRPAEAEPDADVRKHVVLADRDPESRRKQPDEVARRFQVSLERRGRNELEP